MVGCLCQGLPGPPIGPLEVSEITQHTCKLHWHPPKYDGGCKITHYVVERRETTHNQWVVACTYCRVSTPSPQLLCLPGNFWGQT